jgi:hypothetical protein
VAPEDHANAMNKNSRVVVLKHMFTLQELEEDPSLLLELKEDVRDECSTLGEVTNTVLYDVGHLAGPHFFFLYSCPFQNRKSRRGL